MFLKLLQSGGFCFGNIQFGIFHCSMRSPLQECPKNALVNAYLEIQCLVLTLIFILHLHATQAGQVLHMFRASSHFPNKYILALLPQRPTWTPEGSCSHVMII